MLLILFQVVRVSNASQLPFLAWAVIGFMGLAFTAAGGALVFGRTWVSLDRRQDRISRVWGLIKPIKQTDYALSDYDTLFIRLKSGDSDSADQYTLSVRTRTRSGELPLASYLSYGIALDQAKQLQEFLRFAVEDLTTDHTAVLKPSITSKEAHSTPTRILAPEPMRSKLSLEADRLVITQPAGRSRLLLLLGVIIPLGLCVFFFIPLVSFFLRTETPPPVIWAFSGFFLLFFILIPLLSTLRRYSVNLRDSVLQLDSTGLLMRKPDIRGEVRIPLADLVSIDYSTRESVLASAGNGSELPQKVYWIGRLIPSRGLIIKTRQGFHYFGAGLPEAEIAYLHQELSRHLFTLLKPSS